MPWKTAWGLLKETWAHWQADNGARLAAALAYYTIFAIAPLLVLAVATAGLVFGQDAARMQVIAQVQATVGSAGAEMLDKALQDANKPTAGRIAAILSLAMMLLGASGVFGQLQTALNIIWGGTPKRGAGVVGMILERFLSFTMVLGVGFLLLVSLALSAGLAALAAYLGNLLPQSKALMFMVESVVSFGTITVLFAAMYKVLPDVRIAWKDVGVGAAATAFLFTLGKFAIGVYLGAASVGSTYGAAGALLVILVWIYYSAQLLLLGAEFTEVYASHYGSQIVMRSPARAATAAKAQGSVPAPEATVSRSALADAATALPQPAHPAGGSGSLGGPVGTALASVIAVAVLGVRLKRAMFG
ncbi:MAG: YihY/virulence factor BrkB family protein [Chloroflexi bacterium]|nr:YihY/virulence factor BrkB family protein [Chloroflexota bacterium]